MAYASRTYTFGGYSSNLVEQANYGADRIFVASTTGLRIGDTITIGGACTDRRVVAGITDQEVRLTDTLGCKLHEPGDPVSAPPTRATA